jgi:uncharacterized membrane-anchored protein
MNKRYLIIALAFPILILAALIFYKQAKVMIGNEIILPITGFDPRDILSGHYLIYRVDYGIENKDLCSNYDNTNTDAYICLKKDNKNPDAYTSIINQYSYTAELEDPECFAVIKGKCKDGRFTAGIEKFFIPEGYANSLDRAVRNRQGKIVLSVTKGGSAAIKDLLIDGKSWKEYKDK